LNSPLRAPLAGNFRFTHLKNGAQTVGLFDDFIDPGQFQDSGGLPGRLLSWLPQVNGWQSGTDVPQNSPADASSQPPTAPDIGARLGAGFQGWAQTPVGSPFAALANGINGFNTAQQANGASTAPTGSPAPGSMPDPGGRLGAAFQSWALTPVGSPFAALANGINGFNSGQTSIAPTAPTQHAQTQTSDQDGANAPTQNQQAPLATIAPIVPPRRPPLPRYWPR
jgi:hypothetical protein